MKFSGGFSGELKTIAMTGLRYADRVPADRPGLTEGRTLSGPLWRWSELCEALGVSPANGPDITGVTIDSRATESGRPLYRPAR